MTVHRYPFRELLPDYARAAAGFAVTVAPLPWLTESPIAFTIATALAVAFAAYGATTFIRQRTSIQADVQGLTREGLRPARLSWDQLTDLDLRYYSVRRDRQRGWMQLRLSGGGQRMSVDSALDGFAEIVRLAVDAAAERRLEIRPTTDANLRALGIQPPAYMPAEAAETDAR